MPPEFNPGAFSTVFEAFPDVAFVVVVFIQGFGVDQGDEGLVVALPQVGGQLARLRADSLALEIFANAHHVALKNAVGAAVFLRADRLGKVDQDDVAFPVQDIERGKVAVNAALRASGRCCGCTRSNSDALRRRAG